MIPLCCKEICFAELECFFLGPVIFRAIHTTAIATESAGRQTKQVAQYLALLCGISAMTG